MKLIVFEWYYVTVLHIIGFYLPIFGSSILDFGFNDDNRNYFNFHCSLNCPLGYQTDIEGNPMCRCNDPCMNIFCFGDTKCVIEKPDNCEGLHCKPEARCKDMNKKNLEKDKDPLNPLSNEAYDINNLQSDSVVKIDDQHAVCFEDLPTDAFRCRKKRRRYYYDSISGLCIKFRGCESKGNNFARKRDCKRLCIKGRKNKDTSKTQVLSEIREPSGSCSATLAEVTVTCPSALAKRWYFSSQKGLCIRIKGCSSSNKLFPKRRDCKRQCMKKRKGRGRKRARNRKSKSKRRNQRANTVS